MRTKDGRQFPKTSSLEKCPDSLQVLMAPPGGQDMGRVYYFKIAKCAVTADESRRFAISCQLIKVLFKVLNINWNCVDNLANEK